MTAHPDVGDSDAVRPTLLPTLRAAQSEASLHRWTMAGDLLSNTLYSSDVGLGGAQ